ncbi:tetratricopeptide repeat-containing sensor histidine kinase [Salibacter halophilus]|uniref:histidine kinase n=1 Tax=Salibacter halophilus TaxID=1803916 RepID=A0A6N6M6J1_9FLAO|nr:tetratricopeptide repeat-containing sensor histidine kinase [Salibacter halophilus]KAB1065522.1 sensor histidine kinase [Salibacter halophilus]
MKLSNFILFIGICIIPHFGFGQTPVWKDSLQKFKRMPPQKGVVKLESALDQKSLKNDTLRFKYLSALFFRYNRLKPDTNMSIAHDMLELAQNIGDTSLISRSLISKGWIYRDRGNWDSTLYYTQKAEEKASQVHDTGMLIIVANTMAAIYYDLNVDSLKKQYLIKGEELSRSPKYISQRNSIMTNLGYTYIDVGEYDKAIDCLLEADSIQRITTPSAYHVFYLNFNHLFDAYQKKGDYEKAIQYADSAIKYSALAGGNAREVISRARKNVLKAKLGQPIDAEKIYAELKKVNPSRLPKDERTAFYKSTMFLSNRTGNYKDAYETSRKLISYKDSVNSADLRNKISSMRELYEADKREAEIDQLEKENQIAELETEKTKNQLTALAIGLILVIGAGGSLFYYNRKLNRAKKELSELNDTKDQFFAIVSHDLRNATTAFQGLGKIIKKYVDQGKSDRLESLGGKIDTEANHLNNLLDNLLKWSMTQLKAVPTNPEKLELKERTKHIIELFQNQAAAKDVNLNDELPGSIKAMADPNAYDLVMRNLINNAIKFSESGGEIKISGREEGNFVKLEVKDNGKGISREKLDKLFDIDSKKTTKGTSGEKGSGLGLVLCKEYLELNGGKIKLVSEPGKGTTATVELKKAA